MTKDNIKSIWLKTNSIGLICTIIITAAWVLPSLVAGGLAIAFALNLLILIIITLFEEVKK